MSKEKDKWFKFYYDKFLSGTSGFTDAEAGAYIRLIIQQYKNGGIPANDRRLSKKAIAAKFIQKEDGLFYNERTEMEFKKRSNIALRNKKNGLRGGRKKPLDQPKRNPNGTQTEPKRNPLGSENLHNELKSMFLSEYSKKFFTEFYWTGKDGAALNKLIKKIQFKVREKFPDKADLSEETIKAFQFIISAIKDTWVLNNFSIPIINSKFNEIYAQLKNGAKKKESRFDRLQNIYNEGLSEIRNEQHRKD